MNTNFGSEAFFPINGDMAGISEVFDLQITIEDTCKKIAEWLLSFVDDLYEDVRISALGICSEWIEFSAVNKKKFELGKFEIFDNHVFSKVVHIRNGSKFCPAYFVENGSPNLESLLRTAILNRRIFIFLTEKNIVNESEFYSLFEKISIFDELSVYIPDNLIVSNMYLQRGISIVRFWVDEEIDRVYIDIFNRENIQFCS